MSDNAVLRLRAQRLAQSTRPVLLGFIGSVSNITKQKRLVA